MNPQQYVNERNEMLKEVNRLRKAKPEPIQFASGNKDNINDYELINKFKSAVINDDFNLKKVFQEHYSGLKEMKTIEEVKEVYPDIILPLRPENVIADKIVTKTMDRSFFERLDELVELKNTEEMDSFVKSKVISVVESLPLSKYGFSEKDFIAKIVDSLFDRIRYTLDQIEEQDSYTFIPQVIKQKGEILSKEDFKLLSIDYDKFVLSVLREQYINLARIKDINVDGINAASIKELRYKFEKIPSKMLNLISDGMDLRRTQRDYEHFTPNQFVARLNYYTDRFDDNEEILEHLINFGACRFEGEDGQLCAKLLHEIDLVWDKDKSIEEALSYIRENDIKPKGTEKLNEIEYKKALDKVKMEQKLNARLRNSQEKFDNTINILYKNNMNYIAGICSKFRPSSLNENELKNAEYIINVILKEVSKEGKILNKTGLDSNISRWVTYNEYLTGDINNVLFEKAQKFASKNGKIDITEAGKYLINQELVNSYPKSLEYAKNKQILETVMKTADKEKACEYLCKFDSYNDMLPSEKTKILEILKHFDISDDVDKEMLRLICENHYSKVDTTVKSKVNSGGKTVDATITANAKQEMMDYYNFPGYLEFMPAFERALSTHTNAKGNSGIKIFGSNNNAQIYEMEIKIKFKNSVARLVSTKNDYVFDKFIPLGLH